MQKIRIGNDIDCSWGIYEKVGEELLPYNLDGLNLKVIMSVGRKEKKVKFIIEGNVIRFTYLGKEQKHLGTYSFTLIENDGKEGMRTIDACDAFELVARSCDECGEDDGIKVEYISLQSSFRIGENGSIEIDADLSEKSRNPVENRAVTKEINAIKAKLGSNIVVTDVTDTKEYPDVF